MDQPVSGRNTGGIKQISGQLCKYTNVVKGRWYDILKCFNIVIH